MSKINAHQEVKSQTLEANSTILIDSAVLRKKDSIRILHVDDELCLLEVSKQILTMENNFEVENVTSVDEAFKKMEQQPFDVIVSDYEMPQKNGLDFLKELRDQRNDIPFVLYTGKGREDVAVKALNLGADNYINKQGSPETVYCELADAINKTVERKKSRKLLIASESKYRTLVENSLQGILVTKASPLRLVFVNEAMGQILGYSRQDLLSLSPEGIMGLVFHEDRTVFFKRMENRLHGEPAESIYEFRSIRKDGSTIWLSALANLVDYDGQPAVLGMFIDISESKKASKILRESERRYRELANSLPDIVFEADMNGRVIFANEKAPEISGYSLAELEGGINILQFLAPEDKERTTKNIHRIIAGGNSVPTEYKFVRKDGSTFPALIIATPRFSNNEMVGLRGLVIDITERKNAEQVLMESEERFKKLVINSQDVIMLTQADGVILYLSPACKTVLGYEPNELIGKVPWIIHPDDLERVQKVFQSALSSKVSETLEYRILTKQGETRWLNHAFSQIWENGKLKQIVSNLADITDQKKVEAELRSALEVLERIGEGVGAGLAVIAKDYRVVWANKHLVDLGVTPNKKCSETFNNLGVVCPDCGVEKVFEQNVSLDIREYKTINLKGEMVWTELRVTPLKDNDGNITAALVLAVPLNVAKSKDAQIVFQSKLLEAVDESIIATDAQGRIIFWNEAASRTYGWDAIEVLGRSISEVIVPKIAQEDGAKIMETLGQGKRWSGEFQVQRRDGKVFPALVTDSPVLDEKGGLLGIIGISFDLSKTKNLERELIGLAKFPSENPNAIFRVNGNGVIVYANPVAQRLPLSFNLEAGHLVPEEWRKLVAQALSSEIKMHVEEEAKGRLFSFSFSPIVSEGYVNVYGLDITEPKKTLKDLMELTEKLRVVGSLTRHDVGNKLMVAKSNLYLLKKRIGDNPDLVKYIDNIDFALASSDEIFEFSRFYERIGGEKPSRANVFECFNQAAALKPNLGGVKVVNDCQGLVVVADVLLMHLFYNFIDNSFKHGEKVTQIRLHFTKEVDGVKLFYEDNGVGISEANKPKLFHEGFTTGKSTGLGLFLTKKMIEAYGWTITEEGEPGKGAKFTISIPKSTFSISDNVAES